MNAGQRSEIDMIAAARLRELQMSNRCQQAATIHGFVRTHRKKLSIN
jgi:hypothetical protein